RVFLAAVVHLEAVVALRAGDDAVVAEQRRRHRAGRDHERLGQEGLEQQHQHDDDDEGVDDLAGAVLGLGRGGGLVLGGRGGGRRRGGRGAGGDPIGGGHRRRAGGDAVVQGRPVGGGRVARWRDA